MVAFRFRPSATFANWRTRVEVRECADFDDREELRGARAGFGVGGEIRRETDHGRRYYAPIRIQATPAR